MDTEFQFGKCFICNDDSGVSQACSSCMRNLSLDKIHIPAKPKSYGNDSDMVCSYCNTATPLVRGTNHFGILYCYRDKDKAEKDMKNWLIFNNSVLSCDLKSEYPDLYRILINGIKLRRSNQMIDYNWKFDNSKRIYKDPIFGWILYFYKYEGESQSNSIGNKITKKISILTLLNDDIYGVFFRNMIDKLYTRLENGFYNE